ELVVISGRAIINDLERKVRILALIIFCPRFETSEKLCVGDDVDRSNFGDVAQVCQHPCDHGFSGNIKKWFRLVQGEGIKASGVSGGKNQNVHQSRTVNDAELRASEWSAPQCRPMQLVVESIQALCSCQLGVRPTIRDIKGIDCRSALGADPSECDVDFISAEALQKIVE